MDIKARHESRLNTLMELYLYHFKNGGKSFKVEYKNLHLDVDENEEHCTFEYLMEKELITYKQVLAKNSMDKGYLAKITVTGIDYVEALILNSST